jgi:broad-specificity NMP kinase
MRLISIIGNLCTGKSTICKILNKNYGLTYYSIDNYRIKYNAIDYKKEFEAWKNFQTDIANCQQTVILETSGLSMWMPEIYLNADELIIIKLVAPIEILEMRLLERKKNNYHIPFYINNTNDKESIIKFENKLQRTFSNYTFDTNIIEINKLVEFIIKIIN